MRLKEPADSTEGNASAPGSINSKVTHDPLLNRLTLCGEQALYSTHVVRRIGRFIHESPDWPNFQWDHQRVQARLLGVRHTEKIDAEWVKMRGSWAAPLA